MVFTTIRKSFLIAALLAGGISMLLHWKQHREEQSVDICSDEIVGYEAPWVHPRELMRQTVANQSIQ